MGLKELLHTLNATFWPTESWFYLCFTGGQVKSKCGVICSIPKRYSFDLLYA